MRTPSGNCGRPGKKRESVFVCPGDETGLLIHHRRRDGSRDNAGTRNDVIEFSYRVTSRLRGERDASGVVRGNAFLARYYVSDRSFTMND